MTLYFGSCRYLKLFNEEYEFPARLYSTKEFINLFDHYNDIPGYLKGFPGKIHTVIFGEIDNRRICKLCNEHLLNMNNRKPIIHTVIIEVSSLKYVMFNDKTPCNAWRYRKLKPKLNIEDTHAYKLHKLSFSELRDDIVKIKNLIHERFGNQKIKLVIIPHVNLYSTRTKQYIPEREELCDNLLKICNELNIIYASMKDCVPSNVTLEQVLTDGLHFEDEKYKNMLKSHVRQKLSNNIH
jgi:hypothetical protein